MPAVNFRFSTPQDEPALQRVLEDSWMNEKDFQLGLKYGGSNISASLSEDRGTPVDLIAFEDGQAGIRGLASLSVWNTEAIAKMGLKLGNPELKIGYLADLRMSVSASRDMRRSWRASYRSLVESLSNMVLLTSVLDENTLARESLCRGRGGIHYTPVLSYTTITLLRPSAREINNPSPQACSVQFRKGFNRSWKIKSAAETTEIKTIAITDVRSDGILVGRSNENGLEMSVREIWNNECINGAYAIQLAVKSDAIGPMMRAFEGWRYLLTPATLYQVSTESSQTNVDWQLADRTILDISVL